VSHTLLTTNSVLIVMVVCRLANVLFEAVEQSSDAIQITSPESLIMVSSHTHTL